MGDALTGFPDTVPSWPASLDVPGYGHVRLLQPGAIYPAGSTLAVLWPNTVPPVSKAVLRQRAESLGSPWDPALPNVIGVELSKPTLGYTVVNTLTAGAWTVDHAMVIPMEVPATLIASGKLTGDLTSGADKFVSAVGSLAGSMQGLATGAAEGAGSALSIGGVVLMVAPWVLLAGGITLGIVYVYRKAKK